MCAGRMYNVKNGEVRGTAVLSGAVIDLGAQAVAAARQEKSLWVGTMDRVVTCYSNRGKRLKGIGAPAVPSYVASPLR